MYWKLEISLQLLGLTSKKLPPNWPRLEYSEIVTRKHLLHLIKITIGKAKKPSYFLWLQQSFILEQIVHHS